MKVKVAILGPLSLIVFVVSVDVKHYRRTELRSRVKVKEAVLASPFLIVLMVSVDAKQH